MRAWLETVDCPQFPSVEIPILFLIRMPAAL